MNRSPVIIAAGGTGGHVFPALAIAAALGKQDIPVHWVGSARGLEARLVPAAGIELQTIKVSALRGRGLVSRLTGVFNGLRALLSSIAIVRAQRPQAVLGMGGYVAGPVCLAARFCGRRMLVHEQNAISGFTNRLLRRFATRVLEAMPGTFDAAPDVVHTGNPVRDDILAIQAPDLRLATRLARPTAPVRVLVLGGSQGAEALNQMVPLALQQVDAALDIRHQAGANWLDTTEENYTAVAHSAVVSRFIDDMADAYQWADLVICRAGAMTVAELAAVGVGSILVPFPHAVDDHQTANGRYLQQAGAAILLPEAQLTPAALAQQVTALCQEKSRLLEMAVAARGVACNDATQRIVSELLEQKS